MSSRSNMSAHKVYRKLIELSDKKDDASIEKREFLRLRFGECTDHGYQHSAGVPIFKCRYCGKGDSINLFDTIVSGNLGSATPNRNGRSYQVDVLDSAWASFLKTGKF